MTVYYHPPQPHMPWLRLMDWLSAHPDDVFHLTLETPPDETADNQYYNDDILVTGHVIYTQPDSPERIVVERLFTWFALPADQHILLSGVAMMGWINRYVADEEERKGDIDYDAQY